jgi:hypothetical protein
MKNIFVLLALVICVIATAQLNEDELITTFTLKKFYHEYTGDNEDTLSTYSGDLTARYAVNFGLGWIYDFDIKLDTVISSASDTITLQARKFDSQTWTNLEQKVISIAGADTNLYFTENDTAQYYNEMRLVLNPGSGKLKVDYIKTQLFVW